MNIKITKDFQTRLISLKTSGKKQQYTQAQMILSELQQEVKVSKSLRDETRIPNCYKYELPDGYRMVFQEVEGKESTLLALCIGSHDNVDRFLDNHKGWIFNPQKHTLKEMRCMSVETEQVNVAVSPELQSKLKGEVYVQESVFGKLKEAHFKNAGVPEDKIQYALSLSDPDSLEVMTFFDEMPPRTADILLSYITGSKENKTEIQLLLEGRREFLTHTQSKYAEALELSSDEFIDIRDLPEEKIAFDSYPFEDWMLFLHPDQKPLVSKEFKGPARLRGVSGSGKTVVAIHRARHFARKILEEGTSEKVLFVTFNRSLADLVGNLIKKLCLLKEQPIISVLTMDKCCRDYVQFRIGDFPAWQESIVEETWYDSVKKHLDELIVIGFCKSITYRSNDVFRRDMDVQFLKDEIDFIYGKFVHTNSHEYLSCDRTGRVRRLIKSQREVILKLYTTYVENLSKQKQFISKEINRIAYTKLQEGESPEFNYRAIIVDEIQDLSEIEMGILREFGSENGENLFFVGDGAQRIYSRGYSMKNLGINVIGRSFILKQNYRNTREITRATSLLMESQGIGKYDDDPETSQILAKESNHSSEKPLLMIADNPMQEWNTIAKEITYLTKKLNIKPHEICCLARTNWERKGIKETLESSGFKAVEYKAEGIGADDCIKISSLHNSKGHEFRVVFIAGMFDGAIPLVENTVDPENLEKEAALLYVAMTRAKHLLYFSYPEIDEKGKSLTQSRFIDSLQDAIDTIHL